MKVKLVSSNLLVLFMHTIKNMNRTYLFTLIVLTCFFVSACSPNKKTDDENNNNVTSNPMKDAETTKDSNKGIGKFSNVQLTHPLDEAMIKKGQPIYDAKCFACHKLTDEKLVGPGWKRVTDRRTPEWILNFITNTSVMLDSDLIAQQLMVTCLVRMPSQSLKDDEARQVLEFMRKNDGKN